MAKIRKCFEDVEHQGDLDQITDVIEENGGKILSKKPNFDVEEATVEFEVPDLDAFRKAIVDKYYFEDI